METQTANDIIAAVKELATQIAPDVRYVAKYGGEVFALHPDDDSKFVGGVFASKNHVSVEFSQGAEFADPTTRLEGKGKLRRHLKLLSVDDLDAKDLRQFLAQALQT